MNLKISKKLLIALIVLLLLVGVAVTVYLTQQQQDIRQRAATPAATVCVADQPTDTMLIIDKSSSMRNPTGAGDATPRMDNAKIAANKFIDILAKRTDSPKHQVSLTTVSTEADVKLLQSLTDNLSAVKTQISALEANGGTCIECALTKAAEDFATKNRDGIKNVAVLLTDGQATQYIGGPNNTSAANVVESEARALNRAKAIAEQYDLTFFTIGFGDNAKDQLLTNIATSSGGQYFFAPDAATLNQIYTNIAQIIGKGSISGAKFNDANRNGILDDNEVKLNNWDVSLFTSNSDTPLQTTKTDSLGNYTFTGLCDGTYTVKEGDVEGWTASDDQVQQVVTILGAANIEDINFGNSQNTPNNACEVEQAICQWDPITGATSYTVQVLESEADGDSPTSILGPTTINAPTTQVTFPALPGKSYECKVAAVNACGTGAQGSAQASCPIPSATPTPTDTPTPTPTVTGTPPPTPTDTPTPTPSDTPTPTLTHTPTPTATLTPTGTPPPTNTPSPTVTGTPPPTNTPTTVVATNTPNPSATPTETPVPGQPTNTPTPTMASPGSTAQTITIIGGILLTILGAFILFAL